MSDIVERLRAYAPGGGDAFDLMCEAADTIIRLRSIAGKADVGSSFSEMTSELRHQTPVND